MTTLANASVPTVKNKLPTISCKMVLKTTAPNLQRYVLTPTGHAKPKVQAKPIEE